MEADSYQPILNISVMPWATKNLAPSIWHQLYLQTVRDHDALAYSGGGAGSHWSPLVTTLLASSLALISLKVQQYFFTLSRRSSYSSSSIRYLNQSEEELLYVMRQSQPTKKTKLRKSSKLRHARKKSLVEGGGRTTSRRRRWKRLRITKETTTTTANDRRKSFPFVVEMQHTENTKKPSSTLLPIDPRSSSILLPRMREEEEGRCQSEPHVFVSHHQPSSPALIDNLR